jgi:hypothetical protein
MDTQTKGSLQLKQVNEFLEALGQALKFSSLSFFAHHPLFSHRRIWR